MHTSVWRVTVKVDGNEEDVVLLAEDEPNKASLGRRLKQAFAESAVGPVVRLSKLGMVQNTLAPCILNGQDRAVHLECP